MLRSGQRSSLRSSLAPALNKFKALAQAVRWALNFNGVNTFGRLTFRAINPDGDIDIEFKTGPEIPPAGCCVVDQSTTNNFSQKEVYLQLTAARFMQLVVGGAFLNSNTNTTIEPNSTYRVTLIGGQLRYFRNGVQTQFINVARGAFREPSATTKFGCWGNNAGFGGFYRGQLYDIKINGVLWPTGDRDQLVQLPDVPVVPLPIARRYNASSIAVLPSHVDADGYSVMTLNGLQTWAYLGFTIPVVPGMTYVVETVADFQGSNIFYSSVTDGAAGSIEIRNALNVPANMISRQVMTALPTLNRPFMLITRNAPNNAVGTFRHKFLRAFPVGTPTGPELVANGNFDTDTSGWSTNGGGSLAWDAGRAVLTLASGIQSRMERSVVLEPGALYIATADIITFTGTTIARLNILRGAVGSYAGIQNAQINGVNNKIVNIFRAPAADALVQIVGDSVNAGSITVDNISLRKLDAVCNPLVLNNVVPEQWQQVPA